MAALNDLIQQISDPELRARIQKEADRLLKQKKFGLVFEEHIPECTPLYDAPVKRNSQVALKTGEVNEIYRVVKIDGDRAECLRETDHDIVSLPLKDLVTVARFGEPIYPCLKLLDSVCNAPDSSLWHTLIEADNYHALQLLEYLYAGKVDCIYIDPPYNTGAKDWKYNNDYIDSNDQYRHSKWLSMMQKRLKIAKKLLNPQDSVLIVTIDEKEYLHLGCLLEELFPEARIQMISSVINSAGSDKKEWFSRTNEYLYMIMFGAAQPQTLPLNDAWRGNVKVDKSHPHLYWNQLMRSGSSPLRINHPLTFYPIFVSPDGKKIVRVGDPLPAGIDRNTVKPDGDTKIIWPIRSSGEEGRWQLGREKLLAAIEKGYVRLGRFTSRGMAITYLAQGEQQKIESGYFHIVGKRDDGSVIEESEDVAHRFVPGCQWDIPLHNSTYFGAQLLSKFLGKRFDFPKSLYAVHDTIRFFVANKPDALIVDFFAGSGTTLHAVNLLNAEDGGHRRCVMVTNNEVSTEEAETLTAQGHHPGEPEWEKYGIARYVNWPRTVCSIKGHDINGPPLSSEYLTTQKRTTEVSRKIVQIAVNGDTLSLDAKKSIVVLLKEKIPQKVLDENSHYILSEDYSTTIIFDSGLVDEWLEQLPENPHVEEIYIVTETKRAFTHLKAEVLAAMPPLTKEEPVTRPMADGFPANAIFFKLGFLDKNAVALGRQFKAILSTLWMKAGAIGPCPVIENMPDDMLILPENSFAVLLDEMMFAEFVAKMKPFPGVGTVFFITDSGRSFREMSDAFPQAVTYQLYRDYLDNFRINVGR